MLVALPLPQLIEITGPDAVAFAQAQFASDVHALANGHWQWSAWLSAQGRVRAFFHLLRDDDQRLRLLLRGGSAPRLRDALARYVLRAKLQLRMVEDVQARLIERPSDIDRADTLPAGSSIDTVAQETRIALPGKTPRWLLLRTASAAAIDTDSSLVARNRCALADIDAGIVTLDAALEEKLLPDWIGLGELGATSLSKGCYPGQEIVARLHFKGGNKRWLHRIAFRAESLPAPGALLGTNGDDGSEVRGLIVCSAWADRNEGAALAVLSAETRAIASSLSSPTFEVRDIQRTSPPPI